MNGYLGSLIQRSGLAFSSPDPDPLTNAVEGEGERPPAEVWAVTEERIETTPPPRDAAVDPALPQPPLPERQQEPLTPSRTLDAAVPRAADVTARPRDEQESRRAEAPQESTGSQPTNLEEHVHSTVARVPIVDAPSASSPLDTEPLTVPPLEQTEAREIRDAGSGEDLPTGVVNREPQAPPASTFKRAQIWHKTYRSVRDWVAASPSAEEVPAAVEQHDVIEVPVARDPIIRSGMPAPAVEGPWPDPSAVPELHVSIGTISVVIEELAAAPPVPQPARPSRPNAAAAPDWTRLRRLYVR